MVGARARDLYDRQAKERQKESGKVHGRGKEQLMENFPQPIKGDARDQVGKRMGVSGKSIDFMAQMPKRRCSFSFCPALVPAGVRFCDAHRKANYRSIDQRRETSSARGYGARWQKLRKLILHRDPICRTCHNALSTDVDHVVAKAAGGEDSEENLAGRCHACHSRLTVKYDGGFGRAKGQKEQL